MPFLRRPLLLASLAFALVGCVNSVDPAGGGAGGGESRPITGENPPGGDDDDGVPVAPPGSDDAPGGDDDYSDAQPPPELDPDGDGAVDTGEPGPPPSEANQACVEWTDCGPHFADPNSGFDCVGGTCTCDDTGQWATACAGIGGSWSSFECFCYVGVDSMPTTLANPPSSAIAEDEDVVCWWVWKDLGCDPDEWVDTSYYERVCDSTGCYDDYVEDGYYIDGECYGRWIKRCSNGYEYW